MPPFMPAFKMPPRQNPEIVSGNMLNQLTSKANLGLPKLIEVEEKEVRTDTKMKRDIAGE